MAKIYSLFLMVVTLSSSLSNPGVWAEDDALLIEKNQCTINVDSLQLIRVEWPGNVFKISNDTCVKTFPNKAAYKREKNAVTKLIKKLINHSTKSHNPINEMEAVEQIRSSYRWAIAYETYNVEGLIQKVYKRALGVPCLENFTSLENYFSQGLVKKDAVWQSSYPLAFYNHYVLLEWFSVQHGKLTASNFWMNDGQWYLVALGATISCNLANTAYCMLKKRKLCKMINSLSLSVMLGRLWEHPTRIQSGIMNSPKSRNKKPTDVQQKFQINQRQSLVARAYLGTGNEKMATGTGNEVMSTGTGNEVMSTGTGNEGMATGTGNEGTATKRPGVNEILAKILEAIIAEMEVEEEKMDTGNEETGKILCEINESLARIEATIAEMEVEEEKMDTGNKERGKMLDEINELLAKLEATIAEMKVEEEKMDTGKAES